MRNIAEFEGHWRLTRQIVDARLGREMAFAGRAELRPDENGQWLYFEHGILHAPGQADMTAEQRYLWRPGRDGIEVCFPDGRFFHAFNPDNGEPVADHFCDPDQYDVRYDFRNWPDWRTKWRVLGPRKDYRIDNHFYR
ncbi:MAG: DUF6314 family protein [Paracoccaceae bacterium]|nr:DUF6314 family protein [Paracoccaceae bacterium]